MTCYLLRDSLLVAVDPEKINRNRRSIETSSKLFPAQDLFLHCTFSEMFLQKNVQRTLAHLTNIQIVITSRKRCFYICLSVILFTGRVSTPLHAGIHTPPRQTPSWADTPHWADTPRQTPLSRILRDTVNKRAVRILLEYILVDDDFNTSIEILSSNGKLWIRDGIFLMKT